MFREQQAVKNLPHFRGQFLALAQQALDALVDFREPDLEALKGPRQFRRRRDPLAGVGFKLAGKA
ncbi:MAG: hypothetical protein FWH34_02995, partial [Desulfovibrionaceae bacterium]|nr:hypothetical protein [Desulfovibrionaceae bacterium]